VAVTLWWGVGLMANLCFIDAALAAREPNNPVTVLDEGVDGDRVVGLHRTQPSPVPEQRSTRTRASQVNALINVRVSQRVEGQETILGDGAMNNTNGTTAVNTTNGTLDRALLDTLNTTSAPTSPPTKPPRVRYDPDLERKALNDQMEATIKAQQILKAQRYKVMNKCMRRLNQQDGKAIDDVLTGLKQAQTAKKVTGKFRELETEVMEAVTNMVRLAQKSGAFGGFDDHRKWKAQLESEVSTLDLGSSIDEQPEDVPCKAHYGMTTECCGSVFSRPDSVGDVSGACPAHLPLCVGFKAASSTHEIVQNPGGKFTQCEDVGTEYHTIPEGNWSTECHDAIVSLTGMTTPRQNQGPGTWHWVPRGCTWVGIGGNSWTQTYSQTVCKQPDCNGWARFPLVCRKTVPPSASAPGHCVGTLKPVQQGTKLQPLHATDGVMTEGDDCSVDGSFSPRENSITQAQLGSYCCSLKLYGSAHTSDGGTNAWWNKHGCSTKASNSCDTKDPGGKPMCCIDGKWTAVDKQCPPLMKYHMEGIYGTRSTCDYGQTVTAHGMSTFPTSYQAKACMKAVLSAVPASVRKEWSVQQHTITLTVRSRKDAPTGCSVITGWSKMTGYETPLPVVPNDESHSTEMSMTLMPSESESWTQMNKNAAVKRCEGLNMQLCSREEADRMYAHREQVLYPSVNQSVDAWLSDGVAVNLRNSTVLSVASQPAIGPGAGALCCGLSMQGDAFYNIHQGGSNAGNWSLVCSQKKETTNKPTKRPTQTPTKAPTAPTGAPSVSPTPSPTEAPTPPTNAPTTRDPTHSPTATPTFAPTDTSLNPDEVAKAVVKMKAAQAKSLERKKELAQKQRVLDQLMRDKNAKKRASNAKVADKVNVLHKQLNQEMEVVKHFGQMCSSSNSGHLDATAIRKELEQLQLPPEVQRAAMHKAHIVRSIQSVLLKLRNIYQLTDAHAMYALDKLGPKIISLTKQIGGQKVLPDGSVDREISYAPPPPLLN